MGNVISIPAPVGGINARDSYASMPPTDAVYLRDYVPGTTDIVSAPPCDVYFDTASAIVRTIIPYEAGAVSKLLIVRFNAGFWRLIDITVPGAPASLIATLTGGIFVYSAFQSNVVMCNGVDVPTVYNGTTAIALVATGSGLSMAALRGCITFKGRMFYWENASESFWYAAAGAYQGALVEFPIDTITTKGGKVMLLTTFTRDGGEGADDLFVIVMNTGEVLVYQGDDPASAAAWELVGKFQVPIPIGVRSAMRWGARTFLVTVEGLVDLAQVLSSSIYPLLSQKVEESLKFIPDKTINLGSDEANMVTPYIFAETESLGVITMAQDNSTELINGDGTFHHMTLASGAWWDYNAQGTFGTLSSGTSTISCACSWKGRTYYGFDLSGEIMRPMIAIGTLSGEVISEGWVPLANNGYSFAFFSEPSADNGNALAISNYRTPGSNGAMALSAYVRPFGGLTGNLALVQNIVGTITEYWTGFNRKRWIATNVRLKPGGSR